MKIYSFKFTPSTRDALNQSTKCYTVSSENNPNSLRGKKLLDMRK